MHEAPTLNLPLHHYTLALHQGFLASTAGEICKAISPSLLAELVRNWTLDGAAANAPV